MNLSGAELFEQLSWHWDNQLRPRLEGLGDDEYFWEPADGCWTVRVADDGTAMADWSWPAPVPTPITTVGWRLTHMVMMFRFRENHHFGDKTLTAQTFVTPPSAKAALKDLDDAYRAWRDAVVDAPDDFLAAKSAGPPDTIDGMFPFWAVVLHINREMIHHGAEVALLRDLYGATH